MPSRSPRAQHAGARRRPSPPARRAAGILLDRGISLVVAESCTGGHVAAKLTAIPGISQCFLGGVVAYHNDAKIALLDVMPATLDRHGAVSAPVARQMAQGLQRRLGANCSLAVTGIAGPSGATPGKPVGLVFIALARGGRCTCRQFHFQGGRRRIQSQAANAALDWLASSLEGRRAP